MRRVKYYFVILSFLTLGYVFSGGDCGTDSNDPQPGSSVSAPTNVKVSLSQASGSFAKITWSPSADQNKSDFSGYRVVTYEVDSAGRVLSLFRTDVVPKTTNSQVINSIIPLKRYQSFVIAGLSNNVNSDSVGTKIYAAVFENTGSIDEYQATGNAESGYGWDVTFGIGNQYSFTASNAASIDLHLRKDNTGLRFYSPSDYPPGIKRTSFELVGQGQAAFDQTDLTEPASTSIAVIQDNVYLLKLESGNYVKVWVKEITTPSGAVYQRINFDYKVQPIAGLRVLKR